MQITFHVEFNDIYFLKAKCLRLKLRNNSLFEKWPNNEKHTDLSALYLEKIKNVQIISNENRITNDYYTDWI